KDGIRDFHVTGVQTCALPICIALPQDAFSMNTLRSIGRLILAAIACSTLSALAMSALAIAQPVVPPAKPEMTEACPGLVADRPADRKSVVYGKGVDPDVRW